MCIWRIRFGVTRAQIVASSSLHCIYYTNKVFGYCCRGKLKNLVYVAHTQSLKKYCIQMLFPFPYFFLCVYAMPIRKFIGTMQLCLAQHICYTHQCASQSTANSHEIAQICYTHWKYLSLYFTSSAVLISFCRKQIHIFDFRLILDSGQRLFIVCWLSSLQLCVCV